MRYAPLRSRPDDRYVVKYERMRTPASVGVARATHRRELANVCVGRKAGGSGELHSYGKEGREAQTSLPLAPSFSSQ